VNEQAGEARTAPLVFIKRHSQFVVSACLVLDQPSINCTKSLKQAIKQPGNLKSNPSCVRKSPFELEGRRGLAREFSDPKVLLVAPS
jgi:hypothetical protein